MKGFKDFKDLSEESKAFFRWLEKKGISRVDWITKTGVKKSKRIRREYNEMMGISTPSWVDENL